MAKTELQTCEAIGTLIRKLRKEQGVTQRNLPDWQIPESDLSAIWKTAKKHVILESFSKYSRLSESECTFTVPMTRSNSRCSRMYSMYF